jgi:hypothetical protein
MRDLKAPCEVPHALLPIRRSLETQAYQLSIHPTL